MGLGDEIMVTGVARQLQEQNPLPVRVLDRRGKTRWHGLWQGNPRIASPGSSGPVQTVTNGPGRRPYIERETKQRWIWRDWKCPVGELYLTDAERAVGALYPGRVILEPNLKPQANPNKDWGWKRWNYLAGRLVDAGYPVAQLGSPATRVLDDVELICTETFREAAGVLAAARCAILPEGGLHHAAAALGVRAIVIFGGYISPRQTGYACHVNLFAGGEPCGMRTRCRHCTAALRAISPESVHERLDAMLG